MKNSARTVPPGFQIEPPDGGYSWVIAAVSTIIGILFTIPVLAIGLLLPEISRQTNSTAATISWMPAIALSIGLMSVSFNVFFIEKYSLRASAIIGGSLMSFGLCVSYFGSTAPLLFITYGLIFGTGFGMLNGSSFLVLNIFFSKRYGQALGYVIAGQSVSKLIFSPVVQLIIDQYDYQGVLLILGGLSMNTVAIAQLYHPLTQHGIIKRIETEKTVGNNEKDKEVTVALIDNQHDSHVIDDRKPGTDDSKQIYTTEETKQSTSCWSWCNCGPLKTLRFSQLKHPIFYLLFFSSLTILITRVYTDIFLPSLTLENGLTPMQAAFVQSTRSGGEIVGRIFIPWAQTKFKIPLRIFYSILCAFHALTLITIVLLTYFPAVASCSALIGATSGGSIGLNAVLMIECVGAKQMPTTYSLIMFLNGFISLGFGPSIGFLRDVLGSFAICFYVLAAWFSINCLLWMFKPCIVRQK